MTSFFVTAVTTSFVVTAVKTSFTITAVTTCFVVTAVTTNFVVTIIVSTKLAGCYKQVGVNIYKPFMFANTDFSLKRT